MTAPPLPADEAPPPRVAGRFPGRLALLAFGAAALFLAGIAVFQDHLLYFPDNPSRADLLDEARRQGLLAWPSDVGFRAFLREPPTPVRGTIVILHGNAGHAAHRAWYADVLAGEGLRVILAEYPGYGSRPGKLGEAALVADAAETLKLVGEAFSGPLILAGESLGAGVAAAVARRTKVDALLLITPWDSLERVARHHYPWLPTGLLLRDRYDSVLNLSGFDGRLALVVAEDDSIVPARHAQRLYESFSGAKRLSIVRGAEHNDWMNSLEPGQWEKIIAFLLATDRTP